jgi:hypothetical protein
MIKILIVFFILMIVGTTMHNNAYGHGLGLDTVKAVTVDGKKITITTRISPTDFAEDSERTIFVSTTDSITNQNINNVTLLISLFHKEKIIFSDNFFADDGLLEIHAKPTIDGEIKILGEQNSFGAWYETESKPIQLVGPFFSEGGLYHFEIQIKTMDKMDNFVENSPIFIADVTVITSQIYEEADKVGDQVKFGIKSYYDEVSSFDYDSSTNSVTFEMPFDWSEQNISHVSVVHEEVHFPKKFSDFFVPSYVGKVNGVELFKSAITVDDYSSFEDQRIVHFVLSQDALTFLKQKQKADGIDPQNMKFTLEINDGIIFPVIAMTRDEQIQVDLSWDPMIIEPNKNMRFIFTFRNAQTGEPMKNTSYDFVIMQNGEELYKKSANAQIGGDFADYTFSEGQKGHTTIRFENLRGTGMGTEFGITVVPEFGPLIFVVFFVTILSVLVIDIFRKSSVFRAVF